MPRGKTAAVLSVKTFGVCAALVVLSASCGEIQESRYSNAAEARESQRRGWLPMLLPSSAAEIHEWRDLDTNVSIGSFRFAPAERSVIEAALQRGVRRPIRIDRDPSFASTLPRDPTEEQLTAAGFEFYTQQHFAFAISWTAGIAYFWSVFS